MCEAKRDGGRRCAKHTLMAIGAALKNNRSDKVVKEKATDYLVTPKVAGLFKEEGEAKAALGIQKVKAASEDLTFLNALQDNITLLENKNSIEQEMERDYLSKSDQLEYDQLNSDEEKKSWFNTKIKENEEAWEEVENEWRQMESSLYDRVSIPEEHNIILKQALSNSPKELPIPLDYVLVIGRNTNDPAIRRKAIKVLVEKENYSEEAAELEIPKSYEILADENLALKNKEYAKELKNIERANMNTKDKSKFKLFSK